MPAIVLALALGGVPTLALGGVPTLALGGVALGAAQAPLPSLDARAFGSDVLLQIEPLGSTGASRDALVAALEEINAVDRLTQVDMGDLPLVDLAPDGVAALNRAAGKGPFPIDRRVIELLSRALTYCNWSQGGLGPLGGRLYGLWGLHRKVDVAPSMQALQLASTSASCDRLTIDAAAGTATLSEGSAVDAWGFARGYAVDRAVEALEAQGVRSGWVQVGQVTRAFGNGPPGGWKMLADPRPGSGLVPDRILLEDQAIAMASELAGELTAGDGGRPPYVDLRTGRAAPAESLAVLVVTELGIDAEALATALFVMPNREGEYRLGGLKPAPAAKWLLGGRQGPPLILEHNWAGLRRWVDSP